MSNFEGGGVQFSAALGAGGSFSANGQGEVTGGSGSVPTGRVGTAGVSAGYVHTFTIRGGGGRNAEARRGSFRDQVKRALRDATTFFRGVGW